MRPTSILACFLALSGLLTGCAAQEEFTAPGIIAFAMTADTPPFFMSPTNSVYVIESRVELPVRNPGPAMDALWTIPAGITIPYERMPWVRQGDFALEVDYTVSNLSDETVTVAVIANAFNEFHEYVPLVTIVERMAVADYSGYEWTAVLAPGERYTATIREEEMDELAFDLAAIGNTVDGLPPNPNRIAYPSNQHDHDPYAALYTPSVVPALTGFRLGMRVTSEGVAPKMVLEATVRLRDIHDKLVDAGEEAGGDPVLPWTLPTPVVISPAPPAP